MNVERMAQGAACSSRSPASANGVSRRDALALAAAGLAAPLLPVVSLAETRMETNPMSYIKVGQENSQPVEVYYEDHSTYGTGYSRSEGAGEGITRLSNQSTQVVPGDVLYFGKHTNDIPFKYCITLTRRARYRKK